MNPLDTMDPGLFFRPLSIATAEIEAAVRNALSAACGTHLRAVVLIGSLARGEGSLLETSEGLRLLGDAEFLVVFRRRSLVLPASRLNDIGRSVESALRDAGIFCHIDLGGVAPQFFATLPRRIFTLDLRHNGRVVLGDPSLLDAIPCFGPEAIDKEDAWRLLSNRLIEWLEKLAEVPDGQNGPGIELYYASAKLLLAVAASWLVFLGTYEPTYVGSAERFRTLAAESRGLPNLPFSMSDLASRVSQAVRWKICPDHAASTRSAWSFCLAARDSARRLWSWELAQMTGQDPTLDPLQLVQHSSPHLGTARRYRAWLRTARDFGWRRSLPCWPRWCRLARRATPRYWVYALAAECASRGSALDSGQALAVDAEMVALDLERFLPVAWKAGSLRQHDWQAFIGGLAWNYHHLLERTWE